MSEADPRAYLELQIPDWLTESVEAMKNALAMPDQESLDFARAWEFAYGNLYSDINAAEVENIITSEQAWYLREKYLGLVKE